MMQNFFDYEGGNINKQDGHVTNHMFCSGDTIGTQPYQQHFSVNKKQ